jgi:hypothetical protein
MKKYYSIIYKQLLIKGLTILLFSIPSFGQDKGEWVKCFGEAVVRSITFEETQVLAKNRARLDAIEKVCGIALQAESMVKNFILAGDFIHSISSGNVIDEKDMQWITETIPQENPDSPPLINIKLTMSAKVVCERGMQDPSFKIDLKLNRTVFHPGDEVIINVKATRDCFLTVLNLSADDSVRILFPNRWQTDCFIAADIEMEIPEKSFRESGFHVRVANLPGHNIDNEIVKVIATKQKINILSEVNSTTGFGLMGTPKIALTKLARWISEIPVSERAESTLLYEIHARE